MQSDAADAVQSALEHGYLARAHLSYALVIADKADDKLTVARLREMQKRQDAMNADIERLFREMP